jgi:hypothetical protein
LSYQNESPRGSANLDALKLHEKAIEKEFCISDGDDIKGDNLNIDQ